MKPTTERCQRGFSLSEMLIVVAIVGLAVAIVVPLTAETVRRTKVQFAADEFATHLKAARMIAVSKHRSIEFKVYPDPANTYSYPATNGVERTYTLPSGVRIVSPTSETHVVFQMNGSLAAAATQVLEANLTGTAKERFTITTSILGVSTTTRTRVES